MAAAHPARHGARGPLTARRRIAVSFAIGLPVLAVARLLTTWEIAALLSWDTMAIVFIGSVVAIVRGRDSQATARIATKEDDSRVIADIVLVSASLVSLVGVALTLVKAANSQGAAHAAITAVAILSVVVSWAAVQTVFTLRYARIYYSEGGGIDFHDGNQPCYGDFAYVALTLGMTYQVSDTDLTTRAIRMTAVRQALLSYVFGVVVVAMTINVVASLLTK